MGDQNIMKIVIDLDGTLTVDASDIDYADKPVNWTLVERLREYKSQGYEIIIYTARNMRTYNGNVDLIIENTLPIIMEWLRKHEIPHDEVIVGKPWCGTDGFYVDDRAIRPGEFTSMSPSEIRKMLKEVS